MRRKIILRLSLLIVFLTLLWSCQQEDLSMKEENNKQMVLSSKILHYQDLVKRKTVFSELIKLTKDNRSSKTTRTYTDQENGFSVDLEDCMYLEDPKGQKSYTFTILRDKPEESNPDILENFVLIDKGNNVFESYLFQYEKDVQLNYFMSNEELKRNLTQKVKIFGLGKQKNILATSKIALCVGVMATYVEQPGTSCASGLHTYEDGAACSYWGTVDMALPSYGGHFVYTFDANDCYGGGGAGSAGSGSGTTGPYHGGGSGTGTIQNDPCEKTKNMLQNPKVQQAIDDVTVQAKKAALDINEGEIGRIEKNGEFYPADVSEDHHVTFNNINGSTGIYHSHTFKGAKIHSPEDIYSILSFVALQPSVSNYGDAYIGMIGAEECNPTSPNCFRMFHYIIRFSGIVSDLSKSYTEDEMKKLENKYRDREHELAETLPYIDFLEDTTLNKKGFEKLFFETLDKMGLSGKIILQRVDDDGTINNINLDANGIPTATPCPQL